MTRWSLAVKTRKALIDRVLAENMMICGAHFPFPGAGAFSKDARATPSTVKA
jgi:hypothetical protein